MCREPHMTQAYAKGYWYRLAKYVHKKHKLHRRILNQQIYQILLELIKKNGLHEKPFQRFGTIVNLMLPALLE
jgi:hypothetical protein